MYRFVLVSRYVFAMTRPWVTNRLKGSNCASPLSTFPMNRAYNKCIMACSTPPKVDIDTLNFIRRNGSSCCFLGPRTVKDNTRRNQKTCQGCRVRGELGRDNASNLGPEVCQFFKELAAPSFGQRGTGAHSWTVQWGRSSGSTTWCDWHTGQCTTGMDIPNTSASKPASPSS